MKIHKRIISIILAASMLLSNFGFLNAAQIDANADEIQSEESVIDDVSENSKTDSPQVSELQSEDVLYEYYKSLDMDREIEIRDGVVYFLDKNSSENTTPMPKP